MQSIFPRIFSDGFFVAGGGGASLYFDTALAFMNKVNKYGGQ